MPCGKALGSTNRAVTLPEQSKKGFLEVRALKDEGSPGREYYEQRPEERWNEIAGKVRCLQRCHQPQAVKGLGHQAEA